MRLVAHDNGWSVPFYLTGIQVKLLMTVVLFFLVPLTQVKFEIEGLNTYQTPSNKSFKCESEEVLKSKNGAGVQLKVAHVKVEAFRVTKDIAFGQGK